MSCREDSDFAEVDLVQRSLEGEEKAVRLLQETHGPYLVGVLLGSGASEMESEEMVAGLWADCVAGGASRPPLFLRYTGKAALRSWLAAILVNRWISLKRRESVHARAVEVMASVAADSSPDANAMMDVKLRRIVEQAVRRAFDECEADEIVLLQLVHGHGVTRREVAALLGCHESQVGRRLNAAREKIARSTLRAVKEFDPLLELTWEDFLRLCECVNLLGS
jgi:RNA polymerase sigma factor (sigma-70 family)